MYTYKTKGVCSKEIQFELDGDTIKAVQFIGGCNGNLSGISTLVKGMKVDDYIAKCQNIDCNGRGTSCPAQLAVALQQAKNT